MYQRLLGILFTVDYFKDVTKLSDVSYKKQYKKIVKPLLIYAEEISYNFDNLTTGKEKDEKNSS